MKIVSLLLLLVVATSAYRRPPLPSLEDWELHLNDVKPWTVQSDELLLKKEPKETIPVKTEVKPPPPRSLADWEPRLNELKPLAKPSDVPVLKKEPKETIPVKTEAKPLKPLEVPKELALTKETKQATNNFPVKSESNCIDGELFVSDKHPSLVLKCIKAAEFHGCMAKSGDFVPSGSFFDDHTAPNQGLRKYCGDDENKYSGFHAKQCFYKDGEKYVYIDFGKTGVVDGFVCTCEKNGNSITSHCTKKA